MRAAWHGAKRPTLLESVESVECVAITPGFSPEGQNLDTLVESAVQAGYLTRADLEASGDVGGTRALSS